MGLVFFSWAEALQAQISVAFEPAKEVFISHEPVVGLLTVRNNTGRDMVLSGGSGRSWLDFQVTDGSGRMVSPGRQAEEQGPVLLRSNEPLEMKVVINNTYPMGQKGTYRVAANVFIPQMNRYFKSRSHRIQVTGGRDYWSEVAGVPYGRPGAGTFRKYEVLLFFYQGKKELYFRLSDADTGVVRRCFSLGKLLMVQPPVATTDHQNRLHVMHMAAPQAMAHTVIDIDGEPISREVYYEEGLNRPKLVRLSDGRVEVEGGITEAEKLTPYEEKEFRRISELPPGMPMVDTGP